MELIENLLQLLTTFIGALLSGIACRKSGRQSYFLLLCFYGCFALGALYWTLYLLLFDTTPRVFYVSEFGWVASVIFLRILGLVVFIILVIRFIESGMSRLIVCGMIT